MLFGALTSLSYHNFITFAPLVPPNYMYISFSSFSTRYGYHRNLSFIMFESPRLSRPHRYRSLVLIFSELSPTLSHFSRLICVLQGDQNFTSQYAQWKLRTFKIIYCFEKNKNAISLVFLWLAKPL